MLIFNEFQPIIMTFLFRGFLVILLLLTCSCSQKQEGTFRLEKQIDPPAKGNFLIDEIGDTTFTGIPIPIQGRQIDPDSIKKPKKVPLSGRPKVVSAHPNVISSIQPSVVPLSGEPKLFGLYHYHRQ